VDDLQALFLPVEEAHHLPDLYGQDVSVLLQAGLLLLPAPLVGLVVLMLLLVSSPVLAHPPA